MLQATKDVISPFHFIPTCSNMKQGGKLRGSDHDYYKRQSKPVDNPSAIFLFALEGSMLLECLIFSENLHQSWQVKGC